MGRKNIISIFLTFLASELRYLLQRIVVFFNGDSRKISPRENSVLMVEFMPHHGEVIPGIVKYLLDLKHNVDVLMYSEQRGVNVIDLGLFTCFDANDKLRIFPRSGYSINLFLRSKKVHAYKRIIFNTMHDKLFTYLRFYRINIDKLKPIGMIHNSENFNKYFYTENIASLVRMECINRKPPVVVNAHYFGEYPPGEKSKTTVFFTLNSKDLLRRNIRLLFEACDRLYEKGITDFIVKITGNGVPVPEKYCKNIVSLGFLNFKLMYDAIHSSDFILALIDSASVHYTNKASGTYQLSYGFCKPIILHEKFSPVSGFNNENSVLYSDNDELSAAMEKSINLSGSDYKTMVNSLSELEKSIYSSSLENLRKLLLNDEKT